MINEAACFGLPSVCNSIPGIEELVVHGENGYLTEQDDIKSMADYIINILSNRKLRERLGGNAKKMVAKFDAAEIGNKWKYLIKTLLENESDNSRRTKLKKRLSYKVADYKNFSKIIFGELNSITIKYLEEKTKLSKHKHITEDVNLLHVVKYSFIRLIRSVRTKGLIKTSEILVKKIYRKLR